MCSRSSTGPSGEGPIILDTYYYLHPGDILGLGLSGRTVLFLEGQQLLPIIRALTNKCLKLMSDLNRRISFAKKHRISVSSYLNRLRDEEERAAVLLMVSTFSGVRLNLVLEGRTRLKFNAERLRRIQDQAPWTNREKVKGFVQRLVGELAGARMMPQLVEEDSGEFVEQCRRRISRELCSRDCRAGKNSPDNEDLRLVLAISRISEPVEVYVIPHSSRAQSECFGCILKFLTQSTSGILNRSFSHVVIRDPEEALHKIKE